MTDGVDVSDRAIFQNKPVVRFKIRLIPDRREYGFLKFGLVLGMHTAQDDFKRNQRFLWIKSVNATTLAAKIDVSRRNATDPASTVAEPFPLGQIGFTSLERLFGCLLLGNVAIHGIDLGSFAVEADGSRHKRYGQRGTIFPFAHHFRLNAFAARSRFSQAFAVIPLVLGSDQVSDVSPQSLLRGETEEFRELFVHPQYPVRGIPQDNRLRRQLEQFLEMRRLFAQFVLGPLLLRVPGCVVDS